jgi:hypothetical protein
MVATKRLLFPVLLGLLTIAVLSAHPGTASAQNRAPWDLWEHWSGFSVPVKQIAGIAWDGRTLWVLDSATKTVCCLGSQGRIVTRLPLGGNGVYLPRPIGTGGDK